MVHLIVVLIGACDYELISLIRTQEYITVYFPKQGQELVNCPAKFHLLPQWPKAA